MMTVFEEFVAKSRYARWNGLQGRRENWTESVDRYFDYLETRFVSLGGNPHMQLARTLMKSRVLFGSMRALMTAGPALDKDDVASYNCAYSQIRSIKNLRNMMYILMCGTGGGFTVESIETAQFPPVPETIVKTDTVLVVEDSREGWAEAYYTLLFNLFKGIHITLDTSLIRPEGEPLKTFGGRASGPAPYIRLIKFTLSVFNAARGRKLRPIELHDLVCKIADCVVCGGVRRSALISLSDLHDQEMATAKSGQWYEEYKHRALSNNSSVFETKPTLATFLAEWSSLYESKSGERGICNREAMKAIAKKAGRDTGYAFGTNPCSEIILRPNQFCNLSTVVCKSHDTLDTLIEKVELAAMLGTIQSAMTNFSFFTKWGEIEWERNCKEERLLGVSITGVFDHIIMSDPYNPTLKFWLETLRDKAKESNKKWAHFLNIEPSMSVTCIKPEGTTSCVAGSSSGIHPRHSPYYLRRVRLAKTDPICKFMIDNHVPNEACLMKPDTTHIFTFPVASPSNSITISAIDHLELWKIYQLHYCDHKPSITVYYDDNDFLAIGNWVYNNWDDISGIAFLPKTDHVYLQAPFETISEAEYAEAVKNTPFRIDWDKLQDYESDDGWVSSTHTLSCAAGGCDVT